MALQTEIQTSLAKLKTMAPAGYALGFHVRFTAPLFMFQTYDKVWLEHYSKSGFIMSDPVVHWGFTNRGVCDWENLRDDDPQGIMVSAAEHGLKHGISWSIGEGDSHSLGGLARSDRRFTADEIEEMMAIITNLHEITDNLQILSPETADALQEMSISYTHPAND